MSTNKEVKEKNKKIKRKELILEQFPSSFLLTDCVQLNKTSLLLVILVRIRKLFCIVLEFFNFLLEMGANFRKKKQREQNKNKTETYTRNKILNENF